MRKFPNSYMGRRSRTSVTLISFLVITSLIASVAIFIDSNSVKSWEDDTNVGKVSMMVQGESVDTIADQIQNIQHVITTGIVETAKAYLRMDKNKIYTGSPDYGLNSSFLMVGQAYSLEDNFTTKFPNEFKIVEGRYPRNSSEIAIPKDDASVWAINIGRMMNYTHELNGEKRTVFCVGFFEVANNTLRATTTDAVAIVTPDVLNPETKETRVYIEVDKNVISSFDPRGSLTNLGRIEREILQLNPEASTYYKIVVNDYLETGVISYLNSLSAQRFRQISRAQSIILVSGMLAFFATRFNITMREKETALLSTRGASKVRQYRIVLSELLVLSLISGVLGIVMGASLAQIQMLSFFSNYLTPLNEVNSGVLITLDTIVFVIVMSILLPIFGYVSNQMIQTARQRKIEHGRVAKLVRGIKLVRWDIAIIVIIILLTLSPYSSMQMVENNSFLLTIFVLSPIVMFIAIASLLSKSLVFMTRIIAPVVGRLGGGFSSVIGVRSLDKTIRSSLPAVLILSLIFGIIFTNVVTADSIPATKVNDTRFIIGGDLSFSLKSEQANLWSNFSESVQKQQGVSGVSVVSIERLSISEGKEGLVEGVAINPLEYSHVGFTFDGISLDKSSQNGLLKQLDENPQGAILSSDIATEYGLSPGDSLRVFSIGGESETVEFNIIGVTSLISRPQVLGKPPLDAIEGQSRIWLNRNFIDSLVNINESDFTFLTIRTEHGINGTKLGQHVLEDLGFSSIIDEGWSAVSTEMGTYLHQENYILDRSVDNIGMLQMVFWLASTLLIYETSRQYLDSRRDTILDTVGATKRQLSKIHFSEILALILFAVIITLIFAPVLVTTSLKVSLIQYQNWAYVFAMDFFIHVNLAALLLISMILIAPSFVVISLLIRNEFKSDRLERLGELSQENGFDGGIF